MRTINLAENLKSLRRSKKYTQEQLAKLLNVDQRTVSSWETRKSEPSLDMLAKICDVFDESFDALLS